MRTIAVLFLFLVSLTGASVNAEEIAWLDYEEARAMKLDKPIFVFAKMRFCGTCAVMEEKELTNPELISYINEHFVPVKETINFGFSRFVFHDLKDEDGDVLKFRGFPSIMIVQGQDYAISQGYKDAGELKSILSKVVDAKS